VFILKKPIEVEKELENEIAPAEGICNYRNTEVSGVIVPWAVA